MCSEKVNVPVVLGVMGTFSEHYPCMLTCLVSGRLHQDMILGMVKEETGLQHCLCLNPLSLFAKKYGNISFAGKCLYPIEQKATSVVVLCNLVIKSYQPS